MHYFFKKTDLSMYFNKTCYFKYKNVYEMQLYRFKCVFTYLELFTRVATNLVNILIQCDNRTPHISIV
jgi:hypothetical protein